MNPIIQALIQSLPGIITDIRARHAAAQPDAPVPTADEILQAFDTAFTTTILKDEMIRAAHQGA